MSLASTADATARRFQPPASSQAAGGLSFTFQGAAKTFGSKVVLESLNLHVPEGQFLAIVGRSGCGKSTLLRLLSGLEKPTSGRLFHGDGSSNAPTGRSRIMFQEPRLLPWARLAENVAVGLPHVRDRTEKLKQAEAALEQVGLAGRGGDWPSVLSGGQKQRVALARALVSRPRLLSLDEPLGALDALTRIEMQQLLENIWQQQRFTAVLVTHDVTEAIALADRVVVLDNGRVALDLAIPLDRPRRRGSAEAARLEGQILSYLFGDYDAGL
jgi:sulfonate transport system ATP-binding protein